MIHFMTQENFSFLDSQIERAYRRRCARRESAASRASFVRILAKDIALLRAAQDAQERVDDNVAWLQRLAIDVAELAEKSTVRVARSTSASRLGLNRRPARSLAVNLKKPIGARASAKENRRGRR